MRKKILVSTPSRICLFGEHQDYLGLEVIASAINLRFYASITSRPDSIIRITSSWEKLGRISLSPEDSKSHETIIDLAKPIVYEDKRDYLKSAVNTLLKCGYEIKSGMDIVLDSEIPIGKGMSSSTTMVIALIKALLESIGSDDRNCPEKIAHLGFMAEVEEFREPGGMMDHYTSALGGIVHLKFYDGNIKIERIDRSIPGCFIIFDSGAQKDTTNVLAGAKYPVITGLSKLEGYGIRSIKDFVDYESKREYLSILDIEEKRKIEANIDNYLILEEGEKLLKSDTFSMEDFGKLLYRHHMNLRDGLNISTPAIEEILETAMENYALGGKINGSGGGGCAFVYAKEEDAEGILCSVEKKGYKGSIIRQDEGVRKDREDISE